MANFKYIIFALFIAAASCGTRHNARSYSNSPEISDHFGKPKDSLTFYFPQSTDPDSGFLKTYSPILHSFGEPILYNYYLNKDVYRFLWLRSFDKPVVFILTKLNDQVTLTTKVLEKLEVPDIEKVGDTFIAVQADRKGDILYNKTKALTLKNWDAFEQLIQQASFWERPVHSGGITGKDGIVRIMEGHLRDRYWFVENHSINNIFQEAEIYLIKLSGLRGMINW